MSEKPTLYAYAPNGLKIIGTDELIPGTAIAEVTREGTDGEIDVEYTGDTKVHWDGQETVVVDGEATYVDERQNTWKESDLIWKEPESEQ